MTVYTGIFYILAIVILTATALAVTRRHPVHAVLYLVVAFLGTAVLFYLLGAPLLAAFEVIIYAGAIMVLFVFIIMMLNLDPSEQSWKAMRLRWFPAVILGLIAALIGVGLIVSATAARTPLHSAAATPLQFGYALLSRYWFSVEIASFLLLVALVGALYLGRRQSRSAADPPEERK